MWTFKFYSLDLLIEVWNRLSRKSFKGNNRVCEPEALLDSGEKAKSSNKERDNVHE